MQFYFLFLLSFKLVRLDLFQVSVFLYILLSLFVTFEKPEALVMNLNNVFLSLLFFVCVCVRALFGGSHVLSKDVFSEHVYHRI